MKSIILLLIAALLVTVNASCKTDETVGSSDPSDLSNRLFTFTSSSPADQSAYDVNQISITTYNIQSGLTVSTCDNNIVNQGKELVDCHFFAIQEVDINSTHCSCNQPEILAGATGKNTAYLRTIYNQGGMYGHGSGSLYEMLETRYYLYQHYTSELRGILAFRAQPPQLQGRDIWVISTHLQYDSVTIREQQAQELVSYVQNIRSEFPEAFIVCPGDYYSQHGDADYTALSSYLNDSWVSYSGKFTSGATYPSTGPTLRDDYIWFSAPSDLPVKVSYYEVVNVQDSDHSPLRVNFAFPTLYTTGGSALPTQPPAFPDAGTGSATNGASASSGTGSSNTGYVIPNPTPSPNTPSGTSDSSNVQAFAFTVVSCILLSLFA